jgi:hypothetical protein
MTDHCGAPRPADPLLEDLACLAPLTPDPERARRVRERCRGVLARRHQRSRRAERVVHFLQAIVAPAAFGILCVLYTIVVFVLALRSPAG